MKKLHIYSEGFTVIELLVFILVIVAIGVLGVSNIRTIRAQNRDSTAKTDINAVYYQLESFHEKNGYYPEKIDVVTLKGIDPVSLKDKNELDVNQAGSTYLYKPANCAEAKCKSFELSTELEKEARFVKESLNK